MITHTTTVWAVWVNTLQKTTGKNCQGPRFIRGPPPQSTHTTTVWGHGTTVLVNIHLKNYWKTTFIAPCLSGVSLPINTHNHYVGTRNHCVGQYIYKDTPGAPSEYRVQKIARDILILTKGRGRRGTTCHFAMT